MRRPIKGGANPDGENTPKGIRGFLRSQILNRIQRKLIAGFLLVVLLPLLGTALYGNWVTSRALGERAAEAVLADLWQRAGQIETFLASVRGDILFLSQSDTLVALINARARADPEAIAHWRDRLAAEFSLFAQTHPAYYQLRYITEDGWEFVRINASRGSVEVVPAAQLQRKAHRYYFKESINLARGEIFVSPVDLNQEFGQIEMPRTPVIRCATPVFYAEGRRAGILVANLYTDKFLQYAREEAHGDMLVLVDQDGYYLVHPDSDKSWDRSGDPGTGHRLQTDFPQLWTNILSDRAGVEVDERNVIVHVPVFPLGRQAGRYWVLLHIEPKGRLFAAVRSFRFMAATILAAAILGAVTMAVFLARSITAPILTLTEQVKRFGKGEVDPPIVVPAQDEIRELAAAFNDVTAALQANLDRLSLLNQSGQRIASQLERSEVLLTIMQAVEALFDANYRIIRLVDDEHVDGVVVATSGDQIWAPQSETVGARAIRQAALSRGNWQATLLTADAGPAGIMCCAPLCTGPRRQGLIELYGRQPNLGDPATGNLLAALAVQASIALENAELYGTLAEHRTQLETLVERLITAQEEERRMVAYEIHDGLIQRLVGARFHLRNFVTQRNRGPDISATNSEHNAETSLEKGLTQLTAAIAEARRVIEGLRPATLDDLGLVPTLEQYAQELGAEAGWSVTIEAHLQGPRLPPVLEITAFRIAQEALTNARKHAGADQVRVSIEVQDGQLVVEVWDSGCGFDPEGVESEERCMGLISMQERARVLGGECVIESQPAGGTTVRAILPFVADSE